MISNMKNVSYFFSHYDSGEDMHKLMDDIIKYLNNNEILNISLVETLKIMRGLGEEGKLLVLNPLDGKSNSVLNKIMSTSPI